MKQEDELHELYSKRVHLLAELEQVKAAHQAQAENVTETVLAGGDVDAETERLVVLERKGAAIKDALKRLETQVNQKAQEVERIHKEQAQEQLKALTEEGELAFTYVLDSLWNVAGALSQFRELVKKSEQLKSSYNLTGSTKHASFVQPFQNALADMVRTVKNTNSSYLLAGRPEIREYNDAALPVLEPPAYFPDIPGVTWLPAPAPRGLR